MRFLNALRFDYHLSVAELKRDPTLVQLLTMANRGVIRLEWPPRPASHRG